MSAPRASIFGVLTALLLAFCVGAIWPVVGLMLRSDAAWMAIAAGLVAVFAVGMLALERRWLRALVALALTSISIAYAQYLAAAATVTASLGVSFRVVIATMGPEMAFALARARLSTMDVVLIDLGLAIAVIGALASGPRTAAPTAD